MSFWKVNDQLTSVLMSDFYNNLSNGERLDISLREAKLEYLNDADELSAHPKNWAGFVIMGNTSSIQFAGQPSPTMLVSFAVITLAIVIFVLWLIFFIKQNKANPKLLNI